MTSFDMFNNRVPLGLLSEEEQKTLREWKGEWEVYSRAGGWVETKTPGWFPNFAYRAKPIPIIKPSINWDHVSTEYNWLAVDSSEIAYLYENKPYTNSRDHWVYDNGGHAPVKPFSSYSRGNVPWQDSLVGRPVKENLL